MSLYFMSAQIIELVFLACVAFFVIGKLISILGVSDDDTNHKSYFGENTNNIKDVTRSAKNFAITAFLQKKKHIDFDNIILKQNADSIIEAFDQVKTRLPSFDLVNFIISAKLAFKMIIDAHFNNQDEALENLLDKRFLEHFKSIANSYGEMSNTAKLKATIAEIYIFGNNVFVKILFSGLRITKNLANLNEEWTFTRSFISDKPDWYLSNIDKNG